MWETLPGAAMTGESLSEEYPEPAACPKERVCVQLVSGDGLNVVLEFSASVAGKDLKGIDLIRFDEEGRIVEFEVMVRPMSGLQALGAEMGKRLADTMPAFKTRA